MMLKDYNIHFITSVFFSTFKILNYLKFVLKQWNEVVFFSEKILFHDIISFEYVLSLALLIFIKH